MLYDEHGLPNDRTHVSGPCVVLGEPALESLPKLSLPPGIRAFLRRPFSKLRRGRDSAGDRVSSI